MRLFEFLREETKESWTPVLIFTVVSGVANGVLLALINAGASAAASEEESTRLMFMFMVGMAVYILAKRYSLRRSIVIVEEMINAIRLRVCDKIRRSELVFVEKLGRGDLYTRISQDANLISQSAFFIINASQEAIMLVFALFYVAWLSKVAFVVIVVAVAFGIVFYYKHRQSMREDLTHLTAKEAEFLDSLGHIIDGFKEAKLNRKKNDALFRAFERVSDATADLKVRLGIKFVTDIMFSHVFFDILIAVIVFLLPRLMPTYSEVVLKMTAAVLFIIAPLEMIVGAAPLFTRANVALDNLYELEGRLNKSLGNDLPARSERMPDFSNFRKIVMKGAVFRYEDEEGLPTFTLGPIDLEIRRGETVFVVGGNGSGKSTLLKLLTGLYIQGSGTVSVDDMALDRKNISAFRELQSAIFSDFHLFDRLYGLEGVEEERVSKYIREMQLEEKTRFEDGRFTNLSLSTGQRKRLALITSLLEDKNIYVFDEWAADQDAHFREQFYHVILKRLKKEGKTVIAVTHDDRYWDVADRVVKLEFGRITT